MISDERRLVEPRAFVDAVAGVEAHLVGRNAFERGVGRLDIDFGAALHLRAVEIGLEENIRQERIVDLHQNAGVGDGAVFLAELGGERVEILLVGFVIFVDADARRRGGRQEDVMVGHAGGGRRLLDVVDVGLHEFFAAIFYRRDAHHRRQADDGAAHHRLLEILGIIFRKRRDLLLEQLHLLVGAALKAFEALLDVGEEAGL